MTKNLLLALCVVGLALTSAPAWAQDAKAPAAGADKKKPEKAGEETPKVKVERSRGGRKVFRITTGFVIEGRIQKPNAFYVLQRSQINYDWAALKKNFIPRILETVERSPF